MAGRNENHAGPLFNLPWSLVALELVIVPALFAIGALDPRGKQIALIIVGTTVLVAISTLRRADLGKELPIVWLGLAGMMAQLIAGPFLSVAFEGIDFPESLAPPLHEPLPGWVIALGTFGALAVGAVSIRIRDHIHTRLRDVPAPYRPLVDRVAAAAGAWALAEFAFALI